MLPVMKRAKRPASPGLLHVGVNSGLVAQLSFKRVGRVHRHVRPGQGEADGPALGLNRQVRLRHLKTSAPTLAWAVTTRTARKPRRRYTENAFAGRHDL